MLSDEEKKAIESVKDMFEDVTIKDIDEQSITLYGIAMLDVIKVLTIVEKQSKEIEELKEELDRQINVRMINEEYLEKNFISKEKIKEKVEEIKKYKDLARDSIEERIVIADSDSLNYGRKEAHEKDIKVLCSLLEKE